MTDTADSTKSQPAVSEDRPTHAVHPLRKMSQGICIWGVMVLSAFLIGWFGARAKHSSALRSLPAGVADRAADPAAPAGAPRHASMTMLTQSIAADEVDGMGNQLDDPRWDVAEQRAPEAKVPQDVPESQRWQINFRSGTTEVEYARQLAALGVELGVVRSDGTVEYLANPGEADPKRRTGPRADEKRIYWTWSKGSLVKADKSLLKNAGIDAGEDIILHLWPPATAEKLTKLEQEFKGRKPSDIFLTRFAVKRTFRGYEVYVEEQVGR